jgi:hypothetical protein
VADWPPAAADLSVVRLAVALGRLAAEWLAEERSVTVSEFEP